MAAPILYYWGPCATCALVTSFADEHDIELDKRDVEQVEPYNELLARIAMQAEVDVIVLGGMGLKYDDFLFFKDTLEKSGANLCYLTPSHHFPTGVTMPAPRRAQLLAWAAAQPGRYILEDDYDSEFRFDTRPLPSLQGMAGPDGPVVYLTTFSKSLAPGIRIACMVLPQSLLARYRRDFATYANTVSRFEQQTLCEFMAGGYFTRHLARMRLAYKRRMEAFAAALRAALPGVELDGVHSGLHFLLTLPGAGGERAMVAAAAQQGVRLRGLSEYYLARPELCREDTVVAGYSALREEDVERVAQALARAWLCAPGNG